MQVLIIEDERKAARELKSMVESLRPEAQIVEMLESVEEAVTWFSGHDRPDLILSDIQLSDGQSFDIFKKVDAQAPIIFCTAFDEYMMNAFEANGIHYLLKPITKNKLEEGIKKYEELKESLARETGGYAQKLEAMLQQLRPASYLKTLLVNFRDKIIPVNTEDIAYFYYNNGVVTVSSFSGTQYFIQDPLDELETKLNPASFFRANRQFIIHRQVISSIERYFSRKLSIKLSVAIPCPVLVSKTKATRFLKWIEQGQ